MNILEYPPDYLVNSCSSLIDKYIRVDLMQEESKIDRDWVERQLLQEYILSIESGKDLDDASIEAKVYNSAIRKIYLMYIEAKRYQNLDFDRPTEVTANSSTFDYLMHPTLDTKSNKNQLIFYREPIEII